MNSIFTGDSERFNADSSLDFTELSLLLLFVILKNMVAWLVRQPGSALIPNFIWTFSLFYLFVLVNFNFDDTPVVSPSCEALSWKTAMTGQVFTALSPSVLLTISSATWYLMTAGKLFSFPKSHFLHLKDWHKNSSSLIVLLWGLNNIICKALSWASVQMM